MAQPFQIVSGLWRSAYSAEAYREIAAGRTAKAFGYLAALIAIATVVFTIAAQIGASRAVDEFKRSRLWEQNLPEIRIAGGKVSSPAQQPYVKEIGGTVFVLDTTGATTDLDPKYEQGVLVTQSEVIVKRLRGIRETRRYALDQVPDMVLNQANVEQLLARVRQWAWLVVGIGDLIWLWIAKLVQVLFWSLLSLSVNNIGKRNARYGALFRIGILALTVPLAYDVLVAVLGWARGFSGLISLALYLGYLIWGVLSQPKPAEASSSTPG
ncbi:MAG: DUF1189 domain-containing protein [Candidatus Omnitrophica bacterium]|nr:DUF1189 domain-containing protein [Candidatus Omnitrophota bacterium]